MRISKGMTLLEVLLALAIFASASLAVVRTVNQHISSINHIEEKTFASMVADNQLALTMLNPKLITNHSGESELANRQWYWTIKKVETSGSLLQAYEVMVSTTKDGSPVITVRNYVQQSQE